MKRKWNPLIVGNWKLNPASLSLATDLYTAVQKGVARVDKVDVAVAPPAVFLASLAEKAKGKKIFLVAQDVFWEKIGAHTGEISNAMLDSVAVEHVIVGHSEVRERGETDEDVAKKVGATLAAGHTAILCVGEKERDTHGKYLSFVETQLRTALANVPKTKLAKLVVAYEPIWAIGTGNTATPHDAHEMKIFIQKVLSDLFGRDALNKVRVLYGGSVNKKNAEELYKEGEVDGFLVGGASLRPDDFIEIVKTVQNI